MSDHAECDGEAVGPWRRLSSRVAYENPWIRVRHDEVVTPAGSPGIYGVVEFRHRAIGVIPLDAEGHTWLVRQFRYTLGEPSWEIPMGGGKPGEDPQDCARRELEEETGLCAGAWRELMRLHTSNSITDESAVVFVARDLSPGAMNLEDSEADLEVLRLPLAEAVDWVRQGRITDAVSCAGLLRLWLEVE